MAGGRRWGIEPICEVLQVAPSTYWSAKNRPLSARAVRDAELALRLRVVWEANCSVYGRRKLTLAARKAGIDIGRDQLARLMRAEGLVGATRPSTVTRPEPTRPIPAPRIW